MPYRHGDLHITPPYPPLDHGFKAPLIMPFAMGIPPKQHHFTHPPPKNSPHHSAK